MEITAKHKEANGLGRRSIRADVLPSKAHTFRPSPLATLSRRHQGLNSILLNMFNILDLANELQIEIFRHCILEPEYDSPDVRFTLAAVCGHWRDLIFNAPSLWTSITVDIASVIPHPLCRPYDSVLLYPEDVFLRTMIAFRNARDLPVDLTIEVPDAPIPCFNVRHTNLLEEILCDEAFRIASLSISGDSWAMHLSALRGFLNQPMPLLHTVTHSIWERLHVSEEMSFEDDLTGLAGNHIPILQYPYKEKNMADVNAWGHRMYPKLRHVSISGAPYKWNKLPTHGLKTLKMCNQPVVACPSYALIRNLLSFSASTLETLDVSNLLLFSDRDDDTALQPVVLPALKALSFAYQIPDEVTEFLPSIRTPALKRLHITDTYASSFLAEDEGIFPTDEMLARMIQYLSLHQVEKLELNRVVFKDTIPVPEVKDCLMEGGVPAKDVPFTMRFLATLTSLKRLTVWASNDDFLFYLNYPARPSYSKDGQALHDGARKKAGRHQPYLPMLERLSVHGEDENIYWFLAYRAQWTVRQKPLHVVVGETVFDKLDEWRLAALQACKLELAY